MTDSPGRPTPDAPGPDGEQRPADDATSSDQPTPPSLDKPTPGDRTGGADTPAPAPPPGPTPPAPGWAPQQPPPAAGWGPPTAGWGPPNARPGPHGNPPPPGYGPGWGGPGPGGPQWGPPPGWSGPYRQAAKPGVIPLRPLSIGEILDGAFAAMRAHWKVMIGIAVVIALLTQLLEVPVQWLVNREFSPEELGDNPTGEQAWNYLRDTLAVLILPLVVAMLGQIAATGMLTVVVSRAVIAKTMSAREAWAAGRPLLPRLLGVTFATWLIPVVTMLVAILPGLVLLAVGADGLGALLLFPGIIGGLVAAIYLYVCFALAAPALMLEKQSVRKSLERSRKLVTGAWWRVFGVLVLIALILTIIGAIIQMPFLLITDGFSDLTASEPSEVSDPSFTDLLIIGIGAVISSALLLPFAAGATALLYIDQRIRREALDLELARAAGVLNDQPDDQSGNGPATAGPAPA